MAKRHCRFGKVKSGPRKGHCRKQRKGGLGSLGSPKGRKHRGYKRSGRRLGR
jgi:hypothetical protein